MKKINMATGGGGQQRPPDDIDPPPEPTAKTSVPKKFEPKPKKK